jgi:UDP-GlcNAc3NAcA epimerase
VSRALTKRSGVSEILVHTGQHFDDNMSKVFFDELEIPQPAYNLEIGGGSHGAMTGRMLGAIEEVLVKERPDWVLVYGDTNSTLAGALGAVKLHIPVAHVEAGLRSFNRRMPEEINRVLTDHASELLFAPTETAVSNLTAEGVRGDHVRLVGDVMYDAALFYGNKAGRVSGALSQWGLSAGEYVLTTVHRQENTDEKERLNAIISALNRVAKQIRVVLPLHPRTRKAIDMAGLHLSEGVTVIPPVGYLDMVMLEQHAAVIATDSGGVQKEAFFYRVPCVTLRDETEWVELVDMAWNRLATPLVHDLAEAITAAVGTRGREGAPYGAGDAAELISERLVSGR